MNTAKENNLALIGDLDLHVLVHTDFGNFSLRHVWWILFLIFEESSYVAANCSSLQRTLSVSIAKCLQNIILQIK